LRNIYCWDNTWAFFLDRGSNLKIVLLPGLETQKVEKHWSIVRKCTSPSNIFSTPTYLRIHFLAIGKNIPKLRILRQIVYLLIATCRGDTYYGICTTIPIFAPFGVNLLLEFFSLAKKFFSRDEDGRRGVNFIKILRADLFCPNVLFVRPCG